MPTPITLPNRLSRRLTDVRNCVIDTSPTQNYTLSLHDALPISRRDRSHVGDDIVAECGTFDLGRAFHLARKIIGDLLRANGAVQTFDNQVRRLGPAQVTEHHFAAQYHGTGIDLILVGVFWRGAVRGFKNRVAGNVIDVAAGRDADAADLRGQRVAQIIAVQVQRGDDIEIRRAREHLLKRDVGNGVLDDNAGAGLAFGNLAPWAAVHFHRAKFGLGEFITPVAKGALGVFHDVALVDNRHALAFVLDGVLDGGTDEALGAGFGNRLDADADEFRGFTETDFFEFL